MILIHPVEGKMDWIGLDWQITAPLKCFLQGIKDSNLGFGHF
jgi:hypothetical protein